MTDQTDPLEDMDIAVRCLALELPEEIYTDVHEKWWSLRDEISALRFLVRPSFGPDDIVVNDQGVYVYRRHSQFMADEYDYPEYGWVPLSPHQAKVLERALEVGDEQ